MKRKQAWRWVPAAVLLALVGTTGRAREVAIPSSGGAGWLTFNEVSTATTYRVEWAPASGGPWTNTWEALASIGATGSGIVTCSVSMCYRVVATVTNVPSPAPLINMVLIPAGTKTGTDPDFGAYSLTVGAFYVDKYEVTKALWDEVYTWAITNGYSFSYAGSGKAANHPVQTVNWYDCVKWCNARSQKGGRPAVYTVGGAVYKTGQNNTVIQTAAAGYRLPTDVEWEYAARGGLNNHRFPWGDTIKHTQANYFSSTNYIYDTSSTRGYHPDYSTGAEPYTCPVGSLGANGYGLYNMAGNVFEWCFDWVPGYEGSYRVGRGGGWAFEAGVCRVGRRNESAPAYAYNSAGFRTVLSPGQP